MERTLVLFKPDTLHRRLAGEVLGRIEAKGLKIVALKLLQMTTEKSRQHYAEHVSKPFYPSLEQFIKAGPIVALVAEGPCAVDVVRTLMGPTDGVKAPPGTIRGDFGTSRQCNLIHGSDSVASAQREIPIYFAPNEVVSYQASLDPWVCAADESGRASG